MMKNATPTIRDVNTAFKILTVAKRRYTRWEYAKPVKPIKDVKIAKMFLSSHFKDVLSIANPYYSSYAYQLIFTLRNEMLVKLEPNGSLFIAQVRKYPFWRGFCLGDAENEESFRAAFYSERYLSGYLASLYGFVRSKINDDFIRRAYKWRAPKL